MENQEDSCQELRKKSDKYRFDANTPPITCVQIKTYEIYINEKVFYYTGFKKRVYHT